MKLDAYSISEIAQQAQLQILRSTVGDGASEIFIDSQIIPSDSFGVLLAMSQGHPSIMSTNIAAFLCDKTMNHGGRPLILVGAVNTLDPRKIGPMVGVSDGSNLNNVGNMVFSNLPMVIIPPLHFVRFSTFVAPAVVPAAGDFSTIRLQLAVIKLCN